MAMIYTMIEVEQITEGGQKADQGLGQHQRGIHSNLRVMEGDPSLLHRENTEDQGQYQETKLAIMKSPIHIEEIYQGVEYQGHTLEIDIEGLSPRTTYQANFIIQDTDPNQKAEG